MLRAATSRIVRSTSLVKRSVAIAPSIIRSFGLFYAPPPHPTDSQKIVDELKSQKLREKPQWQTKTAEQFIAEVPIVEVDGDVAICDGGDGALGHPREYIQLNKSKQNTPETCKYCGIRYVKKIKHH